MELGIEHFERFIYRYVKDKYSIHRSHINLLECVKKPDGVHVKYEWNEPSFSFWKKGKQHVSDEIITVYDLLTYLAYGGFQF